MPGKLILVVGPSGVGKDTLIDGARARLAGDPRFEFARRAITRPADAGGEDHEAISEEAFERRVAEGAFFAHWRAHGLGYGAPASIRESLERGVNVVLNSSRGAIAEIAKAYAPVDVIHIDAPAEVVAERLRKRGRENEAEIAARRQREPFRPVAGVNVAAVMNSGSPEEGVEKFLAALLGAAHLPLRLKRAPFEVWREAFCLIHEESRVVAAHTLLDAAMVEISANGRSIRARLGLATDVALVGPDEAALSKLAFEQLGAEAGALVTVERSPSPKSRAVLRKKVGGETLSEADIELVMRDLIEGRYSPAETAGFLVSASTNLDFDEIVSLTRVRARFMERMRWDAELVVDKHSMGGIPGSRITLIVAPIVAAHGLLIPKTSSRAITSAAGTADAMEALARVDLTRAEMRAVVETVNGCVAWNGHISHSPIDDVMNAINRPLGVSSRLLDVSSILSKKLAAGSTHVIIDIPVGPYAKIKDQAIGRSLARLFEEVGEGVGLTVSARVSDGSAPIGRGVGPALEVRDVFLALKGDPAAPADLREKALSYAAAILEWDPALPNGQGRARAEELLASGAALESFERMIDAQGRAPHPAEPGAYRREILAPRSGRLVEHDCFAIAGLARAAGAPSDKSAGVDLLVSAGEDVIEGQPILRVHASHDAALERAFTEERAEAAFRVE